MVVTTNIVDMVHTTNIPNPKELDSMLHMVLKRVIMNSKDMKRIIISQITKAMVNTTATTMEMDITNTRNMVTTLEQLDSMDMVMFMGTMPCTDIMAEVMDTTDHITDTMEEVIMVEEDMAVEVTATMAIMAVIMVTMDIISHPNTRFIGTTIFTHR
jgi:hypothetical protein